ncbi:MAG: hypothetical protein R3C20_09750 [Planctomycetaceae bacterium]
MHCDRYWFLTWTTYGTWLPGDQRGFVSDIKRDDGTTVRHNLPGTEYDANVRALEAHAASLQKASSVRLTKVQAELLMDQFLVTAEVRRWILFAVAIMANHCHLVVGVSGDPDPEKLLGDFKSYGSRKLNRNGQTVPLDKRWTKSGSKRKLADDQAVLNAIQYTIDQEFPLVVWVNAVPELSLTRGRLV